MSRNFMNTVKVNKPRKSRFDLSHDVKMSAKMGNIYPVMAMECVPGDFVRVGVESFMRWAPMVFPIMHRVDVTFHTWFCPNRLVWENWEPFIMNQAVHTMPFIEIDGVTITAAQKAFLDYFGVPPIPAPQVRNINALPIAAYQKIYNNWYRDQNLIAEVPDELTDGMNAINNFAVLRKRAWEHDYFTSALPQAQKGPAMDIPLGEVYLNDNWSNTTPAGQLPRFVDVNHTVLPIAGNIQTEPSAGGYIKSSTGPDGLAYDPNGTLSVGATTINDLRAAYRLQEWLELNARVGTRYVEYNQGHFGVRSKDYRLQIPEYISGVKSPVVISEVLNTTGTTAAPQGDMAGHGVAVTSGYGGSYFCEEHGYIITVMSVIPRTAYQDGMPKHFMKNDYLDYLDPIFAHLGEQAIENQEIYAYGANPTATFGYIPRYSEYRTLPSRVAGQMRDVFDRWHLGRKFSAQPTLSQSFVECDADDRIFAVQNGDDYLWLHTLMKVDAVRPLPKFGTPST